MGRWAAPLLVLGALSVWALALSGLEPPLIGAITASLPGSGGSGGGVDAEESIAPVTQAAATGVVASETSSPLPAATFSRATELDVRTMTKGLCGHAALTRLGLAFAVAIESSAALGGVVLTVTQVGPNPHGLTDVQFASRMLTATVMAAGVVEQGAAGSWTIRFGAAAGSHHGTAEVDVVATWVGPKFLGQRWRLPDRNDQPPLAEKLRKCLALTLEGDCGRFGAVLLHREGIAVAPAGAAARPTVCDAPTLEAGHWARVEEANGPTSVSALLDDPAGLNRFNGSVWRYVSAAQDQCPFRYLATADAHRCLGRRNATRLALFGDSMMVELFAALRDILAPGAEVRQGKRHKLRFMDFEAHGIHVRFSRGYTTSQGRSIIAAPHVVVDQIFSSAPHVAIGNLAVLHWQQNERAVEHFAADARRFSALVAQRLSAVPKPKPRLFYMGPTLIQMGRTQGLQPSRTSAFAAAARGALCGGAEGPFAFVDPLQLSAPRRESAFDGQHWMCYHELGGVGHSIAQLFLNELCLGDSEL